MIASLPVVSTQLRIPLWWYGFTAVPASISGDVAVSLPRAFLLRRVISPDAIDPLTFHPRNAIVAFADRQ